MRDGAARALAAAVAVAGAVSGCGGGGATRPRRATASADFVCNQRRAEYVLAGGFVAAESGVIVECEGAGPRLTKWRLAEGASRRGEKTFRIGEDDFDQIWQELDDAGWRNLGDCDNPAAENGDPVYTFDISDSGGSARLTCPGKELPFPFDRLLNALDLPAAQLGGE